MDTPQQSAQAIKDFLTYLRTHTRNATAGVWVAIHQQAGEILMRHLPILEGALPPDQPALVEAAPIAPGSRRAEIAASVATLQDAAARRGAVVAPDPGPRSDAR